MHKHKQYPVRMPRPAGGIRAQEARGGAARSWWAMEWNRHLEAMGMKARLGRGRNYALSGQVTSLAIETLADSEYCGRPGRQAHEDARGTDCGRSGRQAHEGTRGTDCGRHGRVSASVLGARAEPYTVTLDFRPVAGAARARLVAALRADPMLVARLLADDLPLEVAQLFRAEGFDLFPGGKLGPCRYDVTMACNCPDYANPCKHVAAVLILLGEEIARAPLRLLELRGISLEELIDES